MAAKGSAEWKGDLPPGSIRTDAELTLRRIDGAFAITP
jgi:hypothetical protein